MSRKCLIRLLTLVTLFVATPAFAQRLIPFEITRDKKLIVEVRVDGKERILIVDTGAVDLVLDPSVVGLKSSDLKEKGHWNPNGVPKIAERRVVLEIAEKKFGITAAILDCKRVSEIAGRKIDGIIGIVILQQFRKVIIDFENSRLELSSTSRPLYRARSKRSHSVPPTAATLRNRDAQQRRSPLCRWKAAALEEAAIDSRAESQS